MEMESTAALRNKIPLIVPGALATGVGQATYQAQEKGRVNEVEIALGATGSVSGNTTVDVKKNGVSILAAGPASIVQGSATKTLRITSLVLGPAGGGEPSGVDYVEGDLFTVDITAVPGTTSTTLTVYLGAIGKNV